MGSNKDHPHLAFAARYADPAHNYLNAHMAMTRLKVLQDDLAQVRGLVEAATPADRRWQPWFGAEIFSYYSIGFATCLEWHAKSRLVDLLTHEPSAIRPEDVKRGFGEGLLTQMVAKQASVAQMVGAAVKVNSSETYFEVFQRLFDSLNINLPIRAWLLGEHLMSNVCWINKFQLEMFSRLFLFRHSLVHEIGISTMGHWNVRDTWSPDDAVKAGHVVSSIMSAVEAALTRFGPSTFPNALSDDWSPVSEIEQLKAEVDRLTKVVVTEISNDDYNSEAGSEQFSAERQAYDAFFSVHEEFVSWTPLLYSRYSDNRTPVLLPILRGRIEALKGFLNRSP